MTTADGGGEGIIMAERSEKSQSDSVQLGPIETQLTASCRWRVSWIILVKPLYREQYLTLAALVCSGREESRLQETPLTPLITYFSFPSSVETHARMRRLV
ncbi:uncharacterized protein TrAtP1_002242 [Trichoderma atroviride]|uniref:uncharacterized protein n=1 Tax=Hypocrea atroviridis TaxID=63577 RepID=UPI00331FA733|nr:hypothetical protein TrAtP1_002242 [Trichoderma atroviride]